jgi:uncharacterized flavoprotein (TIGR03862 family)
MCAQRLLAQAPGTAVTLFDKRKSAGRKLLIAGSSGLNISNSLPISEFAKHYGGAPLDHWLGLLNAFSPGDWLKFIEALGIGTFEGTSGRYFVEEMRAARLLHVWMRTLVDQGAMTGFGRECTGFVAQNSGATLEFADGSREPFDAVCFALGGGSWEPDEIPLRWPALFKRHGLGFTEFTPSNSGWSVDWKPEFLKEVEGQPLKTMSLTSPRGTRKGEIVITSYGMEGTPVYSMGARGEVLIDLKPDLPLDHVLAKCRAVRENLSPLRRVKKQLGLGPVALALLFHHTDEATRGDLERLCRRIKRFPLVFREPRPLSESISSAGGLHMGECDADYRLKRFPTIHCIGEMLDWDAPTGGFLIQACVSQGFAAGSALARRFKTRP